MIEPPEIVLRLGIRLHREDPEKLHAAIARYKHYRQMTEPPQRHTGAIFKDPPGDQASRLIALANLKGKKHGKAQIAESNANYMVNEGGASASDIAACSRSVWGRPGAGL